MCSTLSWVGSLVDSDCVLWLGLVEVGEGGGGKNFTFQSVQLFFRIRGFYAKITLPRQKVVVCPQLPEEGIFDFVARTTQIWTRNNYIFRNNLQNLHRGEEPSPPLFEVNPVLPCKLYRLRFAVDRNGLY